jgi:hypothetical protein
MLRIAAGTVILTLVLGMSFWGATGLNRFKFVASATLIRTFLIFLVCQVIGGIMGSLGMSRYGLEETPLWTGPSKPSTSEAYRSPVSAYQLSLAV